MIFLLVLLSVHAIQPVGAQEELPDLAYLGPDGSIWLVDPFSETVVPVFSVLPNADDLIHAPGATTWSPDGRWLAAWSAYQISVFQPLMGEPIEIEGYGHFSFLPDSSGVALIGCIGICFYEDVATDVVVRHLDNPDSRRVTTSLGVKKHLALTSDGRRAIYAGYPGEIQGEATLGYSIVVVDLDTGQERVVVGAIDPQPAYWLPDDRHVLFQGGEIYENTEGMSYTWEPMFIGVVNTEDGTVIRLREDNLERLQDLAWSPNRRWAAVSLEYTAYDEPALYGSHLYLFDSQTLGFSRLTSEPGVWDASPTWSPDGQYIAFERREQDERHLIYVMHNDGAGLRRIVEGRAPAWRPHPRPGLIAETAEPTSTPQEVSAPLPSPTPQEVSPPLPSPTPATFATPSTSRALALPQMIGLLFICGAALGAGILFLVLIQLKRSSGG